MTDAAKPEQQLPLFPDPTSTEAPPRIRPWRTTVDDRRPESEVTLGDLELLHTDLVRRDREFLKALSRAGVPPDSPAVQRFHEQEFLLLGNLALLRQGAVEEIEVPEVTRITRRTAEGLAEIRREILAGLDPVQRERALAAEARVRIDDQEIDQALLPVSRLLAEKRAEIAEGKQSRGEEE